MSPAALSERPIVRPPSAPPPSLPQDRPDQIALYDRLASLRDKFRRHNRYYHQEIENAYRFIIPEGATVLEIGCATGDLLAAVRPVRGVGIDFSHGMLDIARNRHPHFEFRQMDAEAFHLNETFDYVIMSGLLGDLDDLQRFFGRLHQVTRPDTRIIIDYYNHLWEPLIRFAEAIGLKMPLRYQNWLPLEDIENLLYLNDFEVVRKTYRLLLPKRIPPFTTLCNRFLAKLPGLRKLSLVTLLVAKEKGWLRNPDDFACTVVIPCRNERGTVEDAVVRTPTMGAHTEIIFVDGNSTDGTPAEIERMIKRVVQEDSNGAERPVYRQKRSKKRKSARVNVKLPNTE